ncbi:hypothetical protein [Amycolatopsis thermophila]|uniref:Uncharacterized protein n=1 Tax=Amycolatopsis thermophila TaxID=206084 RepID=A0ABU0EV80_9PSEU|nr:hypothetical protein [Amycolatopsis thermophila]MDQ0379044.1 hypothetical protein [Amycolatopsis thermophila]
MDDHDWEPVASIGQHGLHLGLAHDGRWVVGRIGATPHPLEDALMPMLPVLEQSYREINRVTSEHPRAHAAPAWELVLRFALEGPSDDWADLALNWIEEGHPAQGLLDALDQLSRQARRAQRTRHRARRAWKHAAPSSARGAEQPRHDSA